MKVSLVNIVKDSKWEEREHLDFQMLSSYLNLHEHTANVINIQHNEQLLCNLDEKVSKLVHDNDFIFFGIDFYADDVIIDAVFAFSRSIKKSKSEIYIGLTGLRASLSHEEIFHDCSDIDYIHLSESELDILNLVNQVEKAGSVERCAGIAYREGSRVIRNFSDSDCFESLPWAQRDKDVLESVRIAKMRTSRGCRGNCNFCIDIGSKKIWRGREINDVVAEMEHVTNTYCVKQFSILDNSIEDSHKPGKERLQEFANLLQEKKLNIYFNCLARAESFSSSENEALVKQLSDNGLATVLIGFESGSDIDLKLYNKRATVEDNLKAYQLFNKYNVNVLAGFIMFNPYSTIETLTDNMKFLREIDKSYSFVSYCRTLKVFSGVRLETQLKNDGLLATDFSYKSPLQYQYVNPNIQAFAESLNNARYSAESARWAITLEYAKNLMARLKKGYVDWKGVVEFESSVDTAAVEFGQHVQIFFAKCIELAESGWNEQVYVQLIQKLEQEAIKYNISSAVKTFIKKNLRNEQLKWVL